MTLLHQLSHDVLYRICQYLPLEAILALYDTHDRAMMRTLCSRTVVPSIDVIRLPSPSLCRYISSHSNLSEFSFNRNLSKNNFEQGSPQPMLLQPPCPISTRLISSLTCRGLTSLFIEGPMSSSAEVARYSETFEKLFPSLTTLVLRSQSVVTHSSSPDNGPLSYMMSRLPPNLHTLVLDAGWIAGPPIEALPASLTSLSLLDPRAILLYAYGEHVSGTNSMLQSLAMHTKPTLHALRVIIPRLPRLVTLEVRLSCGSALSNGLGGANLGGGAFGGAGGGVAFGNPAPAPGAFGGPPRPAANFGAAPTFGANPHHGAPSAGFGAVAPLHGPPFGGGFGAQPSTSSSLNNDTTDAIEDLLPRNTPPLAFPSTLESLTIKLPQKNVRELPVILNAAPSLTSLSFHGDTSQLSPSQLNWKVPHSLTSLELVSFFDQAAQRASSPEFNAPDDLFFACAHISELKLTADIKSPNTRDMLGPDVMMEKLPKNLKFITLENVCLVPEAPRFGCERYSETQEHNTNSRHARREQEEEKNRRKRQLVPLMRSPLPGGILLPPNLVSFQFIAPSHLPVADASFPCEWEWKLPSILTSYRNTRVQLDISDIDLLPETLTSLNTVLTDEWRQTEVKKLVSKLKTNLKIFASNSPVWFVIDKNNIPKESDLLKTDTFSLYDHWMAEMGEISHFLNLAWQLCPVESVLDKADPKEVDYVDQPELDLRVNLKFASQLPPQFLNFVFDLDRFPKNVRMSHPTDEIIRGFITYGKSTGPAASFRKSIEESENGSGFGAAPSPAFGDNRTSHASRSSKQSSDGRIFTLDDGSTSECSTKILAVSKQASSTLKNTLAPDWLSLLAPNLTKLDYQLQSFASLSEIAGLLVANLVSFKTQREKRTGAHAAQSQPEGFGSAFSTRSAFTSSFLAPKLPPFLTQLCIDSVRVNPPAPGTASQFWPKGLTELRFKSSSWTDSDVLETIDALPEISSLVIFGHVILEPKQLPSGFGSSPFGPILPTPSFGSEQPAKSAGFGSAPSFAAPAASGNFTSGGFGSKTPSSTTSGGFGASTSSSGSAPGGFGSGPSFAAPAASGNFTSGGFGGKSPSSANSGGFGASTSSSGSTPGGFGSGPSFAAPAASGNFTSGGFGSKTPSSTTSGGFGASTSSSGSTPGGFGSAPSFAAPAASGNFTSGGFGGKSPPSTTPSGFGASTSSFGSASHVSSPGGFGSSSSSSSTSFGTSTGAFGSVSNTLGSFGSHKEQPMPRRSVLPLKSSTVVFYDLRNELCRLLYPANIEAFVIKGKLASFVDSESLETLILSPSITDSEASKKEFMRAIANIENPHSYAEDMERSAFALPSTQQRIWIEKQKISGEISGEISKTRHENNPNSDENNPIFTEIEDFYVSPPHNRASQVAKAAKSGFGYAQDIYCIARVQNNVKSLANPKFGTPIFLNIELDFELHPTKYEHLQRLEIGTDAIRMATVEILPANLTHLSIILSSQDSMMDIFSSFPRKLTTLVIDSERAIGMSEEGCLALPQGLEKFLCNRLSFSPMLSSQLPARLSNFMFNADEQWSDLDILELSQKHLFRGENNEIEKLVVYNATISGSFVNVANGSESDSSVVNIDFIDMKRSADKALGEKVFCTWSGLSPMFKLPEGNTSESSNSTNSQSSMQIDLSTNVAQKPVFLDLRLITIEEPISRALAPLPPYVTHLALRTSVELLGKDMALIFGKESKLEKFEVELLTLRTFDMWFLSSLPRKLKHLKITYVFDGWASRTLGPPNVNIYCKLVQVPSIRPSLLNASSQSIINVPPVICRSLAGLPREELETLEIPHFRLYAPCMRSFGPKLRLLHVLRLHEGDKLNNGRENNPIELIQTVRGMPFTEDPVAPKHLVSSLPTEQGQFLTMLTSPLPDRWWA